MTKFLGQPLRDWLILMLVTVYLRRILPAQHAGAKPL